MNSNMTRKQGTKIGGQLVAHHLFSTGLSPAQRRPQGYHAPRRSPPISTQLTAISTISLFTSANPFLFAQSKLPFSLDAIGAATDEECGTRFNGVCPA
jgi:hypothetical protein